LVFSLQKGKELKHVTVTKCGAFDLCICINKITGKYAVLNCGGHNTSENVIH
jgi:hypothetical protein